MLQHGGVGLSARVRAVANDENAHANRKAAAGGAPSKTPGPRRRVGLADVGGTPGTSARRALGDISNRAGGSSKTPGTAKTATKLSMRLTERKELRGTRLSTASTSRAPGTASQLRRALNSGGSLPDVEYASKPQPELVYEDPLVARLDHRMMRAGTKVLRAKVQQPSEFLGFAEDDIDEAPLSRVDAVSDVEFADSLPDVSTMIDQIQHDDDLFEF